MDIYKLNRSVLVMDYDYEVRQYVVLYDDFDEVFYNVEDAVSFAKEKKKDYQSVNVIQERFVCFLDGKESD